VALSLIAQVVAAAQVKHAVHFGQIGEQLRDRAIAAAGTGCDHTVGERLGLVIDKTEGDAFSGGFVTDRRLAWAIGKERGNLPWSELRGMTWNTGLVTVDAKLHLIDGRQLEAPNLPEVRPLCDLICRYAPPDRIPAPVPLTDRGFVRPDARHQLLLDVVDRRRDAGQLDAGFADELAARVMLLHRTTHFGRGTTENRWITPLLPRDLLWVLGQVIGPPLQAQMDDQSCFGAFAVPPRWTNETVQGAAIHVSLNPAKAIGRNIGARIANQMLAGWGIGGSVDHIEVGASAQQHHTRFAVDAVWKEGSSAMFARNREMLALFHRGLFHAETRYLLLRALGGREPLPGTLAALPAHEVAARLGALGLDTDLRWFGY
jgi:hypothetical protein